MTACFGLIKALDAGQSEPPPATSLCGPCVYFTKNLDKTEYPIRIEKAEHCGLGFVPGDDGCTEMRTDNCSTRKSP